MRIGSELGCLTIIFILLISMLIGGFCWTYSINTWLHFFGKAPAVRFYQGALIGLIPVLGQVSLPVAVITWIVTLFI